MSMAHVFNPYTGGATGGLIPGGGGSGVQWIDIEDLAAFPTSSDPDTLILNYTYDPILKTHEFEFLGLPNIGVAYNDYSIATTLGTFKAPRWSKQLVDENGTPMTTDDEFTMLFRVEDFTPDLTTTISTWSAGVFMSRDNTSTNRGTCLFHGMTMGVTNFQVPTATAVQAGSNTASVSAAGLTKGIGNSYVCGVGTNRIAGTMVTTYSPTTASNTARTGAVGVSAATPLYLEVICPTQGNTLAADTGYMKMKFSYAIVRT